MLIYADAIFICDMQQQIIFTFNKLEILFNF